KRREIARINIATCFPEFSPQKQQEILFKHFESLGMSLIAIGFGWWKSEETIRNIVEFQGREHLEAALKQGKGVILLSGHFNSLETSSRLFSSQVAHDVYAVYQANSNPLLDKIIFENRSRTLTGFISHKDIRQMIYKLRDNAIVWYAPDQGYRGKYSALVDFFGIPAASNTATSKLARLSKSAVLPFFIHQKPDYSGYILKLQPPIENFPTKDEEADVLTYHHILEDSIREAPEQYLWIHRRFKGRPAEYPDLYKEVDLRH
ncbi:MAG: lipid A biosynthesis acyltransferase, partial [Gammaproteobacteria bacterium]|nr:lipid A biosynthesis acyltransferase [Gammaproteobacteria bacterium]